MSFFAVLKPKSNPCPVYVCVCVCIGEEYKTFSSLSAFVMQYARPENKVIALAGVLERCPFAIGERNFWNHSFVTFHLLPFHHRCSAPRNTLFRPGKFAYPKSQSIIYAWWGEGLLEHGKQYYENGEKSWSETHKERTNEQAGHSQYLKYERYRFCFYFFCFSSVKPSWAGADSDGTIEC